ncbi:hypothetical protein [Azospirillum argentinense]
MPDRQRCRYSLLPVMDGKTRHGSRVLVTPSVSQRFCRGALSATADCDNGMRFLLNASPGKVARTITFFAKAT